MPTPTVSPRKLPPCPHANSHRVPTQTPTMSPSKLPPCPQANSHRVPKKTPTMSPHKIPPCPQHKHPPCPHTNPTVSPLKDLLYNFFKASPPPISPPKPPLTLVVTHSQGLLAFLQAGRTRLPKPSAGGCGHQTAATTAGGGGSALTPAWQSGTRPSGLQGWGGPQPAGPEGVGPRACHGSPCTLWIPMHSPETHRQPPKPLRRDESPRLPAPEAKPRRR